ncbi:DNA-directed RNA polymerase II subunit [Puccinia graminis f. sp. tritici]|uniref:DNA-directed RNA polymerase II subunit n=1 Tax=Puccinia graminis f. sp. tritici TaxID=56615 RepID=A0A5B0RI45_PUCGR|nr:DNA-directed RNA polymerase II subunit [Puccinia graminis f. sp. tritici]
MFFIVRIWPTGSSLLVIVRLGDRKELSHTINLHPSFFGPRTSKFLEDKLNRDVEGTCTGRFGYIIAVLKTLSISAGTIQPGTGMAEFVMKYSAIVLKPFKGEVVDGIVGQVNKMGFFVEVGPLQAFVSSHLIPSDLKFDPNANPPCFSSDEDQATIEKGTRIRLKIVGTRVDATEIFAIGTIKEDYLGPID